VWLLLAGSLVAFWRGGLGSETVAAWPGVGAAVLAASAAFFAGSLLNHLGAGLAAALLLSLHPLVGSATHAGATPLQAEALALVTWAGALGAWQLTFQRRMSWPGWAIVGLAWVPSLAFLWTIEPHTALVASTFVLLGYLVTFAVVVRLG